MATYASEPAWELRARAVSSARVVVPLGIGALLLASALLRTRHGDVGFWIDEGLSVGIADRPLTDIPGVLRQDGSPPLYYLLLNLWIGPAGRAEDATHWLSLVFALATIPVALWAGRLLFNPRAGWIGAALAAFNPFLTQYAQETRMYTLVILLGLICLTCWLRAFTAEPPPSGAVRWAPTLGFAASYTAMLYTHNWSLFLGAATGLAFLVVLGIARGHERGRLVRTAAVAYGATLALYLPWLPSMLYQSAHTGAPWAQAPSLEALMLVPERLLGEKAVIALALAAGAGVVALLRRRGGRLSPEGRATLALIVIALGTLVIAWSASQVAPAWASRYLAAGLPPLLLLATGGLAYAGRLGLAGLALAVVLAVTSDQPPREKSNVRTVAAAIAPSLRPGDLVISTQPEQIPVLDYYLPDGLRYATLTGPVSDLGVTDWRDGVERLEATTAARDLQPLLDSLPVGRRLVLVTPIFYDVGRWSAPWTRLVRLRSAAWAQRISNDRRLQVTARQPASVRARRPNPVQATVLLKTH